MTGKQSLRWTITSVMTLPQNENVKSKNYTVMKNEDFIESIFYTFSRESG